MANFPHMSDTEFPNIEQVDVWKFKNDFPYENFDDVQMRITICAVPWDVGLIHVGNAQIGGLGNVVAFEDEAERNLWFENLEDKFTFETEYRKFHMQGKGGSVDGTIKLPIPYDVLSRYNYAIVEYTPMPVHLEKTGVRKWFYFIRESFMKAANTTEVELILDAWQTFIYGMKIPYMMLERGHAPISALSADEYLANPVENTRYVTGADVTFDDAPSVVTKENEIVFNDGDKIYACMICDAALGGTWGNYRDSWRMPNTNRLTNQGVPNYICVGMPAENFNEFLTAIDGDIPQFKQCVKAVFFASEKMITLSGAIKLSDKYTFNYINGIRETRNLLTLDKEAFGYDEKYAGLAKLYTFPYAHIEIMDENGESHIVRVEDTSGKLDIATHLSTVFPYIKLTSNVLGIGGNNNRDISFKALTTRRMRYGGKWQDVKLDWDVPTFAVVQGNGITSDYATWYDRQQMHNNATTAKANANASAATAKTNADNTARTAKTNANNAAANAKTNTDLLADTAKANTDADAATVVSNAGLDTACNNSMSSINQTYNNESTQVSNAFVGTSAQLANKVSEAMLGVKTEKQRESTGISSVGGVVGGFLSGGFLGGVNQAVQANMQMGVTIHASAGETAIETESNSIGATNTRAQNTVVNGNANSKIASETSAENSKISGQAANTAATMRANATRTRDANKTAAANTKAMENTNAANTLNTELGVNTATKNTEDANATRTYDNAQEAIANFERQNRIKPTNTFGEISNGETATTRPMAVFAQVVTQNSGAIAAAGDEMLRFGYQCNMNWQFTGWNLMRHFTYWKVSDLWIDDFRLPDAYADRIRFALMGGVCVWRSPDIIGKTSIYENM